MIIEMQIILILIGICIFFMLRRLITIMREISKKISDKELYSSETDTPRPLLPNLENLRDDVGIIKENLYRIMEKYDIEQDSTNRWRHGRDGRKI